MKKAILYVFSGTGNTLITAKFIAGELEGLGYKTRVELIRRSPKNVPDPRAYDIVGFGYPVHAFNVPLMALRYVKRLPDVSQIPAFIFKTSGEPFGMTAASSYALYRILKKRGFDVRTDTHMLMPYNVIFRYKDALAKQMYLHTQAMGRLAAQRAHAGERDDLRYPVFKRVLAVLFRIQWFGAWINGPLHYTKKKLCNLCGLCVKSCPAKNIRIKEGKVCFSSRCTMCMRCSMGCPKDAVRPGILTLLRINGLYNFPAILNDKNVSNQYVDENTKGYFKFFLKYYRHTQAQLERYGITLDHKTQ